MLLFPEIQETHPSQNNNYTAEFKCTFALAEKVKTTKDHIDIIILKRVKYFQNLNNDWCNPVFINFI